MASPPLPAVGPNRLVWPAAVRTGPARSGIPAQLAAFPRAAKEWLAARVLAELVLRVDALSRGADCVRACPRSRTQPSRVDPGRMCLRSRRLRRFHSCAADGQRSGLDAAG